MKKLFALVLAVVMVLSMAAVASAEVGNGILEVNMSFAFESTTNFRNNTGRDQQVMHIMYEQLGIFDVDGNLVPWVAKSWTTSDGGFTYDVEIYDYVTDSQGNNITADDIIWNIEESKTRALKPCFSKVESVTKTGDYSFQIKMTGNIVGAFEAVMSDVFVVSKAAFEASPNEFADQVVSTSAYLMTEFVPTNSISFEKRADYWQTNEELIPACVRPNVEKIRILMIQEASQVGIALETGKIDLALTMDTTTATQYVNNSAYVCEQFPGNQGWQIFFSGHESRPVAENVKLRQAICYAIDGNGLVQALCQGYGTTMADVCSPRHIGYNPAWEQEDYYGWDLAKAQQLIKESGYNGEELSILVSSSNSRMAQVLQGMMMAAGLNIKIDAREVAQFVAIRLDGSQYDMFINTIGGTYCADHWSIRYDPNAYATGDGTARHDYVLGDLLYKTWTVEGYTQENIDAVHEYIRDNAIAYGMYNPTVFNVYNAKLAPTDIVLFANGGMAIQASTYTAY